MACQSGIRANDKLIKFFNECKAGNVRLAKIIVKNEELCVNFHDKGSTDWRTDFRRFLPDCVDAFEPCFILFRIDSPSNWLLISFADDCAPVREKMVFAATRATFKAEFGQSNIKYEFHVTNKKNMTVEAFEKWISGKEERGPMSDLEKELDNAHREIKATVPPNMTSQTLKGVYFPVDQDAEEELRKLYRREINYVQLAVDTLNEAIKLEVSKKLSSPDELKEVVPCDKPRYHFYQFSYTSGGESHEALFFIYSMPSSGCTIKERMLYSSCKQPFLQSALTVANLRPDKKIEVDSREILSSETLIDFTKPPIMSQDKGFARPPGPPQRGTRRVTKAAG